MNIKAITNYAKYGAAALGIYALSNVVVENKIEDLKDDIIETGVTFEDYEKIKNNAEKHSNSFIAIREMLDWQEALDSLEKKAEYEKSQLNISN